MSNVEIKQYYSGGNLRDNILKRSNIRDKELYLNPAIESLGSPYDYNMMRESVNLLHKHASKSNDIGILVDCDVDGYTSGAIIAKMLQSCNNLVTKVFHQVGKEHGLSSNTGVLESVLESGIDLLIIPDAGSNDHGERDLLLKNGVETIVIDHHIIEDQSKLIEGSKFTVNNQRSDNGKSNEHLTGAGMCLKFAEAYYDKMGLDFDHIMYYDLAAIGQIGDMSDLTDPEVRFIVMNGLRNVQTSMFVVMVEKRLEGVVNDRSNALSSIDIAFNISPLINATTRIGTQEEKELLFESIVNDHLSEIVEVERRRKIKGKFKNVILEWNQYEYALDIIDRIKNRQDRLVKNLEVAILDNIHDDGDVAVAVIEKLEDDESSLTGLVANRIASKLEKPTLILREEDNEFFMGSGRGYDDLIDSFKDWCSDTKLFEFAKGHDAAFGCMIKKDNIKNLIQLCSRTKLDRDVSSDISVDLIEHSVDENRVQYGYYLRGLTNHNVDDILYGYKSIKINKDLVRKRGSVTTIWESGVEFIIFNDHSKVYDILKGQSDKFINVDIVGRPNINFWMGSGKTQIVVEHVQISE